MAFELPKLPYSYDSLAPTIDAKTMEIHHTKHHQTYITKLNEAVAGTDLENKTVEELLIHISDVPEKIRPAVQNHGGGHANHSLFWTILSPTKTTPEGSLLKAIDTDLGGMTAFTEKFTLAAMNRFGSGWAWLNSKNGKLTVESTLNQDSPLMTGSTPILGIDVWEHAYYLNYQNRRADYIQAFFNIINWTEVQKRYDSSIA